MKNALGITNIKDAYCNDQPDDIYTDYLSISNYNTYLGKIHAKLNVFTNILSQVQTYTQSNYKIANEIKNPSTRSNYHHLSNGWVFDDIGGGYDTNLVKFIESTIALDAISTSYSISKYIILDYLI